MLANWHTPKRVNSAYAHDIKLELDVRCQKLIEKHCTPRSRKFHCSARRVALVMRTANTAGWWTRLTAR